MIAPETLLKMRPLDALRAQIAEMLKPPLLAQHLKIGPPVSLGGVSTKVTVSLDRAKAPVELWGRVGSYDFTYNREDLSTFTAGMSLKTSAQVPATTTEVLNGIFDAAGIPIVDGDLTDVTISALGNVSFVANANSYRWIGSAAGSIDQLLYGIAELLMVTKYSIFFDAGYNSATLRSRLANAINDINQSALPVPVTTAMFTVGVPVVNGPIADGDNTALTLTFSAPYIGSTTVYYARRGFEDTFRFPINLSGPQLGNLNTLANLLTAQMGCTIVAADLAAATFPALKVGDTVQLPINFADTSLGYVGTILSNYTRTS